jgi:Ser/Thr protein kinase RdoA (MazF antagonist)
VLRKYPQVGAASRLLSYSPRPFSAASLVATPMGKVFVKRHHESVRDREGLLEEHRLIAHLSDALRGSTSGAGAHGPGPSEFVQAGLVQPVFADQDSETVAIDGEWIYEVHPPAPGVDVYEKALSWTPFLCTGHARAAGRALARLHRAAQSYEAPPRKLQQLVTSFTIFDGGQPLMQMDAYLQARPMLREYAELRDWRASFCELLLPLYEKLEPWLPYLQPLWTHNDFHASNMTWNEASLGNCENAQVLGVIDFGLANRTNAVHDLATAIERNVVEWLRIGDLRADVGADLLHLDHLDALLCGYEELSPLRYEETRALIAMLPLVHCEFALAETDYFLSVLRSPEKATLAYEGYFLAHARWFAGVQGQRLLGRLENWAEKKRHADWSER